MVYTFEASCDKMSRQGTEHREPKATAEFFIASSVYLGLNSRATQSSSDMQLLMQSNNEI